MINTAKGKLLIIVLAIFSFNIINGQDLKEKKKNKRLVKKISFLDLRGTNALDIAVGSSILNGDLPNPEFEFYFRIGYKRHLTSHLNFNLSYNKYNIAYEDIFNEGFMSFDFNLEYLIAPFNSFSPYVFVGGGYNADNDFENTINKVQGGLGFEYMLFESFGLKLFGEYNYAFSDELDGLIAGNGDDVIWRMGFGANIYFGGKRKKEKILSKIKTVINSNLIK